VNLYPILLDSRPSYLENSGSSLLFVPLGTGTLLDHLVRRVSAVSPNAPVLRPTFEPAPDYGKLVAGSSPRARVITTARGLDDFVGRLEPSDWLLIVDPRCFPVDGFDVESLLGTTSTDPRWVRHLVALDASVTGTREHVDLDHDQRVRRIQRYYDAVTWPFAAGVACSLLPASCGVAGDLSLGSLADIRRSLASRGVPSRDLPMQGGALDLSEERGLLALSDRFVLEATAEAAKGATAAARVVGKNVSIHSSSRIVGPVILHDGVVVEEDATILGPALLGVGVRVGPNAIVAQSVIAAGISVGADWVIRHRALFDDLPTSPPAVRTAAPLSYRPTLGGPGPVDISEQVERHSVYQQIKRAIDFAVALAILIPLSPLLLVIAILIRLDSEGPILYGHPREGRGGNVFRCWKFRTMFVGAAAMEQLLRDQSQVDGPQFKISHDPRITRLGRILRRLNLDELPQILNVLLGQMSFVGPRPSPFRENQRCVPWREARLSVPPGITGLWQVCRHDRDQGDFHQWIQYDLLYVQHQSLLLDLKILLATVVALSGRGHVPVEWLLREPSPEVDLGAHLDDHKDSSPVR
jgi:lipopolysaccharide/colanic/teichoic acid biosynthesis glycosyltransferase